jgi:hypothetical protein
MDKKLDHIITPEELSKSLDSKVVEVISPLEMLYPQN